MSNGLIIICYVLCAYGACNVIAFGSGPFRMFEYLRYWASCVSEHFASLFSCMMCLPTNFGLIFSLVDWFLIPDFEILPFNMALNWLGGWYWILAMLCDAAFTSGAVWLIHTIQERIETNTITENPENYTDYEEDDMIEAEDITKGETNGKRRKNTGKA